MVPHRKILRAIALVSYCATDSVATRNRLCDKNAVRFPGSFTDFWTKEVTHWLTPALQALMMTTDAYLTNDVRPILEAARILEVSDYIFFSHKSDSIDLDVSETILKWRSNNDVRLFIETEILCGMEQAAIAEDLRRLYGIKVDEADIRRFGDLYCDREFALGDDWFNYTTCIGAEEAGFKVRMMAQNREYVRWKLGVPIALDSDIILDRMMSDGYFTCQQIKAENDNNMSPADLQRVKLERETIFKCMDRKIKYKEASGGNDATEAVNAIGKIALKFSEEKFVLKEDLLQQ
jgi:hypothetical protein